MEFITNAPEQTEEIGCALGKVIKPGTVIAYDRNYVTNEILENAGIEVLRIPSGELSRGRGGPRCMSMPLLRELAAKRLAASFAMKNKGAAPEGAAPFII